MSVVIYEQPLICVNPFFATKNVQNFHHKMASFDLFSNFQGLLQGGWASHRETGPLTGKHGLTQGGRTSLSGRPGLSQGGRTSYKESRPLTGRLGLSKGGRASHQGRPGLLQGGRASHKEAI